MTAEDRKLLQQIHEKQIESSTRMDTLDTNVGSIFRVLQGNGRPGIVERVGVLESSLSEHKAPKRWPERVVAICAIITIALALFCYSTKDGPQSTTNTEGK